MVSSRNVKVAGQSDKGIYGPLILEAVGMVDRRTCPGHDRRRFGTGKKSGCPDDQFGRDAGNLFGRLGREAARQVSKFIKAQGPAVDEIPVVNTFFDDNVGQSEGQSSRGPGP